MLDYGIYRKIELLYRQHGVKVCVDSAFKLGDRDFLIKSSQQDLIDNHWGVVLNQAAMSLQQLSEHGMRMIPGQFPRLKDSVQFKEFGERKVILHLMVLLYNYQIGQVGINHIKNSFMSQTNGFHSYGCVLSETANGLLGWAVFGIWIWKAVIISWNNQHLTVFVLIVLHNREYLSKTLKNGPSTNQVCLETNSIDSRGANLLNEYK